MYMQEPRLDSKIPVGAVKELAQFWRDSSTLADETFVSQLEQRTGLSLIGLPEKRYGTIYTEQSGFILTPFVKDLHTTIDKIVRKASLQQIHEAKARLFDDSLSPLNKVLGTVSSLMPEHAIPLYGSQKKNNHVVFHHFSTLIFGLFHSVCQYDLRKGKWDLPLPNQLRQLSLSQNLARAAVCSLPKSDSNALYNILSRGCRQLYDYAEEKGIIVNTLMKYLARVFRDKNQCRIDCRIVDIQGDDYSGYAVNKVIPIDHNGMARSNQKHVITDQLVSDSIMKGLYGSLVKLQEYGSANIPSMASNTCMTGYRLLAKNREKVGGKMLLRTGVTTLRLPSF